jgi:hypothetical protein
MNGIAGIAHIAVRPELMADVEEEEEEEPVAGMEAESMAGMQEEPEIGDDNVAAPILRRSRRAREVRNYKNLTPMALECAEAAWDRVERNEGTIEHNNWM